MAISVILADDETMVRDALVTVLGMQDGIDIIGEAARGDEAVDLIARLSPDIAVLDLQMPGLDGIDAAIAAHLRSPATRYVIVTSHARPGYVKKALASGVAAFVPKTTSARQLAEIIRHVAAGGRYVDPELSVQAIAAGDSPLTPRESDVLELAADGAPVEEIAQRAHLSAGTVRNYLSAAVAKLGTTNRHEAAALARARGWID
jgi:two-component system response regulator DesR